MRGPVNKLKCKFLSEIKIVVVVVEQNSLVNKATFTLYIVIVKQHTDCLCLKDTVIMNKFDETGLFVLHNA